jgi:hypothetical protein
LFELPFEPPFAIPVRLLDRGARAREAESTSVPSARPCTVGRLAVSGAPLSRSVPVVVATSQRF